MNTDPIRIIRKANRNRSKNKRYGDKKLSGCYISENNKSIHNMKGEANQAYLQK